MCYPESDLEEIMKDWISYQKVLARIVKRLTGKSVDEQFKLDVENFLYDLLANNVTGVAEEELLDAEETAYFLCKAYPNEYLNALKKYRSKNKNIVLLRSLK